MFFYGRIQNTRKPHPDPLPCFWHRIYLSFAIIKMKIIFGANTNSVNYTTNYVRTVRPKEYNLTNGIQRPNYPVSMESGLRIRYDQIQIRVLVLKN